MICWHRQNVSCVQIVSVHHSGDVTAMFAPDLHFFDPYPLFVGQKRGSPSKNYAPRNILGLPNPHRARRRGAVPMDRQERDRIKATLDRCKGLKVKVEQVFSPYAWTCSIYVFDLAEWEAQQERSRRLAVPRAAAGRRGGEGRGQGVR